jgi:parvulin-like peptidyl-prolyl isomerase
VIRRTSVRLAALAVTLAVVGIASGCSNTLHNAATVVFPTSDKTVDIGRTDFQDELREVSKAQAVLESSQAAAGGTPTTASKKDDSSVDSALAANWLQTKIYAAAFEQMFDARKLKTTSADRAAARDSVYQAYGGEATFKKFPKALQSELLRQQTLVEAISKDEQSKATPAKTPTEADARAYYDAHKDTLTACDSGKEVAHILVADAATANQLKQQLDAGASFADLAAANSTDTGSAQQGGKLGCLQPNAYVAEFQQAADSAPLNQVVGPVQSQYGYHLILVTPFSASYDDVKEQVLQQLQSDAAQAASSDVNAKLVAELNATLKKADVKVDPRYGTWKYDKSKKQYTVVAPTAPKPRTQREPTPSTTSTTLAPVGG